MFWARRAFDLVGNLRSLRDLGLVAAFRRGQLAGPSSGSGLTALRGEASGWGLAVGLGIRLNWLRSTRNDTSPKVSTARVLRWLLR